jgi:hypothetical protein
MKALKEKRIGLRSLLRRGLVILSLFALVFAFASCAESDDDGGGTTVTTTPPPAKFKPSGIEIVGGLKNNSYEGLALDLTGLKVKVYYEGGPENNKTITIDSYADGAKAFSTYPPVAVGVVAKATLLDDDDEDVDVVTWIPQTQYELLWVSPETGKVFTKVLDLKNDGKTVKPIARATSWTDLTKADEILAYGDEDSIFNWSKGLNFTGTLTEKIYVDNYPDLGKYRLQAEYVDGVKKDIPLDPETNETNWKIVPKYAPDRKSAKGDLFVTVAKNPLEADHPFVKDALKIYSYAAYLLYDDDYGEEPVAYEDFDPEEDTTHGFSVNDDVRGFDPAMTIRHPYEEIYIVQSIKVNTEVEIEPFFYWQDDTEEEWFDRLMASNATITVNYSGGAAPKTKTPKELADMNKVWYNDIFDVYSEDAGSWRQKTPFAVRGIQDTHPQHVAMGKNRDPKITVSYRGAYDYIETPVYTRLMNIEPAFIDGGNSTVDMRPTDNDVGGMDAVAFDGLITVVATYSAYKDNTLQKPWTVTFDPDTGIARGQDIVTSNREIGGVPVTPDGNNGDKENPEYYGSNFGDVSTKVSNNGKEVSVVFYYAGPEKNTDPDDIAKIAIASRRVSARLPVTWKNITAPNP